MISARLDWSDFYLICFAAGFFFSFFSFIFGSARFGRLHLPHFHGHAGGVHLPSPAAVGHAPVVGGAHAAPVAHAAATHAAPARAGRGAASPFNFVTLTAFLAWFGGTGYLLTRYSALWVGTGLFFSVVSGLTGGGIIFLFLSKVLMSDEENLDPADYEMVGVLGRITSPIRAGGTGELLYSQVGTRRVCGARSEDGSAVARGIEVVVTRYEKGIAYVRLWSEMSGESSEMTSADTKTEPER